METRIRIFYSYAHEDQRFMQELSKHLERFDHWHDGKILAGTDWEVEIEKNLNNANVFLLLISPDFMASEYCYKTEMTFGLEKRNRGEAIVVPVILSPVAWENDQLRRSQALPTHAKPVTKWRNRNDAYEDIVRGLRLSIGEMLKQSYITDAKAYSNINDYQRACTAYQQALHFSADDALLQKDLGDTCFALEDFLEAQNAYSEAIRLQPGNVDFYLSKGKAQSRLEQFKDAYATYGEALKFTSDNAVLYESAGDVLLNLKHFDEALEAYKEAIRLMPSNALLREKMANLFSTLSMIYQARALEAYNRAIDLESENILLVRNKGNMLADLDQWEKALEVYDEVIKMMPADPSLYREEKVYLYKEKGDALFRLNRLTEALDAYESAICFSPDFKAAQECVKEVLERMARQRDDISASLSLRTRQEKKEEEHSDRVDGEDPQVN